MAQYLRGHRHGGPGLEQFGGAVVAQVVHVQVRAAHCAGQVAPCFLERDDLSASAAFEQQRGRGALRPDAAHQVGRVVAEEQHAGFAGLGFAHRDGAGVKIYVRPDAAHDFAAPRAGVY